MTQSKNINKSVNDDLRQSTLETGKPLKDTGKLLSATKSIQFFVDLFKTFLSPELPKEKTPNNFMVDSSSSQSGTIFSLLTKYFSGQKRLPSQIKKIEGGGSNTVDPLKIIFSAPSTAKKSTPEVLSNSIRHQNLNRYILDVYLLKTIGYLHAGLLKNSPLNEVRQLVMGTRVEIKDKFDLDLIKIEQFIEIKPGQIVHVTVNFQNTLGNFKSIPMIREIQAETYFL
jgi:hypothetical protein